jgi:amidophosphoribosyltransferase
MFERIYFSRNCDPDIYQERKALGKNLAKRVLDAIDWDIKNAVFTYIPNSSETPFLGLIEEVSRLTQGYPRAEKLIHKNQKIRTFIANDASRKNMVAHLYDVTKGIVKPTDTLIAIDDSIVRGTTLKESILTRLAQLNPKRIIIVSAAPPIMYPDCYGIDMSQFDKFIAFHAAVELAKENGLIHLIDDIANLCYSNNNSENLVSALYAPWSLEQLSKKISDLARPKDLDWQGEICIIFQTVQGTHAAIPHHTGDWYFTGNYPTPGGYRVLNKSYLNWYEHVDTRSY